MNNKILIRSNAIFDGVNKDAYSGCLLIEGNTISKVIMGSDGTELIDDTTKVLDYGNNMVMAGFIDDHDHFFDGTVTASDHMCDISAATSETEAVEMLKEYYSTHPTEKRIRAIGWFPAFWNNAPLPTCRSLDEAFPDIPVYCIAVDFHTFWCNSLAIEESGYTQDSVFDSGYVGKFEDGTLNGLIFEPQAFTKAKAKCFEFSEEEQAENLMALIEEIVSNGVTSVAEMSASDYVGGEATPLNAALKMSEKGELNCRVHIYSDLFNYDDFTSTKEFAEAHSNDMVRICGLKSFVDGVSATYTAYLLDPYTDRPDTRGDGCPVIAPDVLSRKVTAANSIGLPVRLHCIGDAAVRQALDAFEASRKQNGDHGCKNTIEHIETIHPDDLPRFAELDVIASSEPLTLPQENFEKVIRCGEERCRWEWPYRSLLDAGAKLAFGSDYPVVGFNPYPTIYAAATRCFEDGKPCSVNPEECITVYEALMAYTLGAAEVFDRAHELGTLEEGKLADITVVDRNLLTVPVQEINDAKSLMTMVDGKIVYERASNN